MGNLNGAVEHVKKASWMLEMTEDLERDGRQRWDKCGK